MGDMRIAVSPRVQQRDAFGQFAAQIRRAGEMTMSDAQSDMTKLAKAFAPRGHKRDPRTIPLKDSIRSAGSGETALTIATARHALPQETGSVRHDITGRVNFFWERKGRQWRPGSNTIDHPGNPPHPYLRPAYDAVMARIMQIARRYYPQ